MIPKKHTLLMVKLSVYLKMFKIFLKKSQTSWENKTNMDINLLFLAKPLDKHGVTLAHITYPRLGFFVAA